MQRSKDDRKWRKVSGLFGRVFDMRRQSASCPWCLQHRVEQWKKQKRGSDTVFQLTAEWKFERWAARPNRAKALYWRMHPDQYPWSKGYRR